VSLANQLIEGPLPRPYLYVGVPVAGALLVFLFVAIGFPYDALGDRIAAGLSQASGNEIRFIGVHPRITVGGPGLKIDLAAVTTPRRVSVEFEPLSLRPAWSFSWLRGEPLLHIRTDGRRGSIEGYLRVASEPGFQGRVENVDLALLPLSIRSGLQLTGRVSGEADLRIAAPMAVGHVDLQATSGSLVHNALPLPLGFDELKVKLSLGGEQLVAIETLTMQGPLVSANVTGGVAMHDDPGNAPLDLVLNLTIDDADLTFLLSTLGIRPNAQGAVQIGIGGTLAAPAIR